MEEKKCPMCRHALSIQDPTEKTEIQVAARVLSRLAPNMKKANPIIIRVLLASIWAFCGLEVLLDTLLRQFDLTKFVFWPLAILIWLSVCTFCTTLSWYWVVFVLEDWEPQLKKLAA